MHCAFERSRSLSLEIASGLSYYTCRDTIYISYRRIV